MKKFINIILPIFMFAMFIVSIINVQAKTITSLDATEIDGKINISGTAESGTLAVAIMIYDSTGDNLITMQTTSVAIDNTYKDNVEIENGTYIIKVADYDGGEYIIKTVSLNDSTSNDDDKKDIEKENTELYSKGNPETGDNIFNIIFISLLSLVGLIIIGIYLNKKKILN